MAALGIEPTGDRDEVRECLDEWARQGKLDCETCEARVEGSFDDKLSDDHAR
jgi:hypothetical protein